MTAVGPAGGGDDALPSVTRVGSPGNTIEKLELETAGAVTLTVCDVVDWPVVAA